MDTPAPISLFTVIDHSLKIMKHTRHELIRLGIFCVFLPLTLSFVALSQLSQSSVQDIQHLSQGMMKGDILKSYYVYILSVSHFMGGFMICSVLVAMLLTASYLGLVKIAVNFIYRQDFIKASGAFRWGLKLSFFKGLLLLLGLVLISLEKIFFGPLKIFTAFAMVAPVILSIEKLSVFSSLRRALSLSYVNRLNNSVFNIAMILITLGFLLLSMESLGLALSQYILQLDEWIAVPRYLWITQLSFIPLSIMQVLAYALSALFYSMILVCSAYFSVSLYHLSRKGSSY